MANQTPGKGLSLYADLIVNAPGTITGAPVIYKNDVQKRDEKKNVNPAFRFQPTKRPQQQQKVKARTAFPKAPFPPTSSSSPSKGAAPPVRSTLADWTRDDDDDVNGFYKGSSQRARGGRRKKKKIQKEEPVEQNWDDIYDLTRPNVFQDYRHSEEKYRSIAEWKDRLHAHEAAKYSSDSARDDDRGRRLSTPRFVPPASYNFAPPKSLDPSSGSPAVSDGAGSGDDAYAQPMQFSQATRSSVGPPKSPTEELMQAIGLGAAPTPSESQATTTISRAPVRYNISAQSPEATSPEAANADTMATTKEPSEGDAPRTNRPGQKGFGQRMMAKMGYVKGKGLGANEDGIITALQVKPEKRKKKPDAEGGGFADRGGMGRIIGGKRAKTAADEEGEYGQMSEVVVVWGMLDGIDLEEDSNRNDGGIRQEIGDALRTKYGTVERIYLYEQSDAEKTPVYIKFATQLYAHLAVTDFNKDDYKFNGNDIKARFYDADKFKDDEFE